jgi:hypothetical protein
LQVERLEDRNLLSFQVLGTLGTTVPLPTGTAFRINDFEPNALNNQGDVVYGDDLGTANDPNTFFGEGVFLRNSHGQETVLGSANASAPGGGTFFEFEGPATLNNQGDAAVDFLLQPQPASGPFGVNSGAYRYLHSTQTVSAVVVPYVTPAPGGGTFQGVSFGPSLDNQGDLYFVGIVPTANGVQVPDNPGLGMGVFKADLAGHITSIVSPGDPAPGGGTFDDAGETYSNGAWVNGRGDVAFVGHVAGEEALVPGFGQPDFFATLGSVYVKSGATGQITSIAHAGDPAPGGGVFRQALFPGINDHGDVVFTGDLTPAPDANQVLGVFLNSGGTVIPIARPGDAMPGGGHLFSASDINGQTHLNNQGDVVFNATLDTSTGGVPDTGLYQWSHGRLSLIARSGTVLPGVGTIASLTNPAGIIVGPPAGTFPFSGAINNDRGQVFFAATLTDGRAVLLLYTPTASGGSSSALFQALTRSGSLPTTASTHTAATRRTQLTDANVVAFLASTVGPPAVGSSAMMTVQHTPSSGSSSASLSGRDNGSGAAPASPFLMRLAGAVSHRAVDAVFAGLGINPLGDPLANVPF